ncbi:DUF1345 domain-containing protein [Gellertiella hungarica]|uniref:Putative membrane protein n=1 Tax=Gellertiella hungarica TaxID=1572859 RepID=A0A7W6J1C2_9HYPH|nr:DUF1345 domain-containing protein [Gellertiella hungarica]MBB4062981.1 putative membrane protein [Gellertiella hungarica]
MADDGQRDVKWSGGALFRLHPALIIGLGVGVTAWLVLHTGSFSADNLVIGWDVGVFAYLVVSWYFMLTSTVARMKRRANDIDLPDSQILFFSLVSAVASLSVIFLLLQGVHQSPAHPFSARPIETVGTLVLSWIFVHTLFTVHYAHTFYANEGAARGLRFPEDCSEPVYWDFLYFSFTIGVAAQTADVSVTSMPMRRLVLAHSILSFLFNTTILALAVNVGASLI